MIDKYIKYLKKNHYSENTIKTYNNCLKMYKDSLQDMRLIKNKLITYFNSPATAICHYNVLNSYFKWTKDKRLEQLKEIRLPRLKKVYMPIFKKDYLLKKTEISETDNSKEKQKKLIIKFLFETGIRCHELKEIIEINKKTLTVKGKGNKIREIFHNPKTTKEIDWEYIKKREIKTIREWSKELLGPEFPPHSIRRSFATHLLLKGANPKMVMMQLGHEKIETTYRYLQLSVDQNQKQYEKFF